MRALAKRFRVLEGCKVDRPSSQYTVNYSPTYRHGGIELLGSDVEASMYGAWVDMYDIE